MPQCVFLFSLWVTTEAGWQVLQSHLLFFLVLYMFLMSLNKNQNCNGTGVGRLLYKVSKRFPQDFLRLFSLKNQAASINGKVLLFTAEDQQKLSFVVMRLVFFDLLVRLESSMSNANEVNQSFYIVCCIWCPCQKQAHQNHSNGKIFILIGA